MPLLELRILPITIDPPFVPSEGEKVTLTKSVNVRDLPPKSPTFELGQKIDELPKDTIVTILTKEAYLDPVDQELFILWAEIEFSE